MTAAHRTPRSHSLFIGNFEFEHRLQAGHRQSLPEPVRRLNEELAALWIAVAEDGDFLWMPAPIDGAFFDELAADGLPRVHPVTDESQIAVPVQLCPWGWTEDIRRWAHRNGWTISAPRQSAVRQLNARSFSFRLEREWAVGLPGAVEIHALDEFVDALQRLPGHEDRWILKAEFGMSAREQLRGRGQPPTEAALNWTRRRLQSDGRIYLEPRLDRLEEAGLQFTIPETGPPRLEGITPLLADSDGTYRGNRFSADSETEQHWQPAVEVGLRAAECARQLGYFGPLGIDAMRYRDADGHVRLRPLQDINARWTMGRLSLGFRKLLRPGESGTWLHLPWPAGSADSNRRFFEDLAGRLPPDVRAIRTSPFEIAGRPTRHGTILLLGKESGTREARRSWIDSFPGFLGS